MQFIRGNNERALLRQGSATAAPPLCSPFTAHPLAHPLPHCLSAPPQVVGVYTQRLQVQERITHQLADAVVDLAMPEGVMVGVLLLPPYCDPSLWPGWGIMVRFLH